MPEGFMGASGFRPLVTAWEMTAWRFSFSSSISRRCSSTSASILAVSRSEMQRWRAARSSGGARTPDFSPVCIDIRGKPTLHEAFDLTLIKGDWQR